MQKYSEAKDTNGVISNASDRMVAQDYERTMLACFTAFFVQAIINNFLPLLFLTFQEQFGIRLEQIALLISFNFLIQLAVDFLSIFFVDRVGYKPSLVVSQILATTGLIAVAILPRLMSNVFAALLIAVFIYAVGGGLIEVLTSPVVDATPSPKKGALMSLTHSFYCWGHVIVVLVSTLFFSLFGLANWPYLALFWALVPAVNAFLFASAPMPPVVASPAKGRLKSVLQLKRFWFFFVLMMAAGAMEQSVSQWASTFAEAGLGVSKTLGDLAGPVLFATFMGISRTIYARSSAQWNINRSLYLNAGFGIVAYLVTSLSPIPWLAFVGSAVVGFCVGIMWPGTLTLASEMIPRGGTALFALLALAGDVGCSLGPYVVGLFTEGAADNLSKGILVATIFPILIFLAMAYLRRRKKRSDIRPLP